MAHHRYQTEAIILGSVPRGESNRSFFLFTKEFGLIAASAQGVRKVSSKLKGSLSDFSYVDIDLIRGEEMWRVVDVQEKENTIPLHDTNTLRFFARFSLLIRRLMHGERSESHLFKTMIVFRNFLIGKTFSEHTKRDIEIVMAVKVLHELGYGGDGAEALRVHQEPLSHELLSFVGGQRRTLTMFVNTRLRESHL